MEKNGQKKDYSLYPDEGTRPGGTQVIEGRDVTSKATASLYKTLTPEQEIKLQQVLAKPEIYSRRTNNCSHYVANVCEQTTGLKLPNEHKYPDGVGGEQKVASPIGLEKSIRSHELQQAKTPETKEPEKLSWKRDTSRQAENERPSQEQPRAPERANEPERLTFKKDQGRSR